MTSRPWTTAEVKLLIENRHKGAMECAALLNRSELSVRKCAYRNRISLRRRGSKRGLILGQPRGTSLTNAEPRMRVMAELRELALQGRVDLTEIERRIREDHTLDICPECYQFPVRHPNWGVCDPCHKRDLAAQHRESLAVIEAQRELNACKQAANRARKEEA